VLIDELLQFSRTGRQEIKVTRIEMNVLISTIRKSLEHETNGRNIQWSTDNLPVVPGDHNLLQLVWFNLLSNAIKFTRKKENAVIHIGYREESQEHVFYVKDNGAGFDMRYVEKLFGVFQRLHSLKEFEGTGIGLANVRRIISKHGGQTWAEGIPGEGATFYFSLPKKKK
jgi:two-component system, chemotaxis family, sensor kinase Cph1